MFIRSIHIYGFGKYHDFSLELKAGINVIEGSNEAGKSTLLSFIKAIFFGFESRRLPEARYEPLEGGKFGGSVVLVDMQGNEYQIERTGQRKSQGMVKVVMPDGTEHGEEMLFHLLLGMSPMFYANIFAFGLSELSYLTSLTQEEVASYLYSAGTGISLPSLRKVWNEEKESLFKPRGSQPLINQQLSQLEEIEQQIRRLQRENESYNELLEKRNELDRKAKELETKITEIRFQQKKWEKLREAYPICKELKSFVERLQELPTVSFFPENGLNRLEELEKKILELTVEWEEEQDKLTACRQELSIIPSHPEIVEMQEKISLISKEGERWMEKREILSSLEMEVQFLKNDVQRYLQELGAEWTEEVLQQFDASISKKEIVRDQRQKFHQINTSLQAIQEMIQTKELELEECRNQHQKVQHQLKYMETMDTLGQMEENLSSYQLLLGEIELEQKQKDWLGLQFRGNRNKIPRGYRWVVVFLFLLASTGSIALTQRYGFSWGTAILFISVLLGSMAVYFMAGKRRKEGSSNTKDSYSLQIQTKIRELDMSLEEKKNQCKKLASAFQGSMDVSQIKHRLHQIRSQRESYLKLSGKLAWLEEKEDQLEKEWKKLINRKESFLEQKLEEEERWNQQLNGFLLPLGLSPDGALDMLSLVSKAKELLEKQKIENEKVKSLQRERELFENNIRWVCDQINVPWRTNDPWIMLRDLQQIQKQQEEYLHQKRKWDQKAQDLVESINKKERLLIRLGEERELLFKQVAVDDSESFRRIHSQFLEQKSLEERIRMLELTLETADINQDAIHQVDQLTFEQIELKCAYWAHDWTNTQLDLQEIVDQRGQYKNRLHQLESGENLSRLNQQRQELIAEAESGAKRWIVLRLAQQLLDRTQESYEAQRQPGVLKEASSFFKEMTHAKYLRVISPIGEERLIVERNDGMRLEPGYLSRGTREQLFLSLRFGLIRECSKDGALPIILDDILVNFDEQRKKAAMKCLRKIESTHQILYFTCQSHTAKLMDDYVPNYHYVDLDTYFNLRLVGE